MYDDNQMNNNVPRFDSQTGEPLLQEMFRMHKIRSLIHQIPIQIAHSSHHIPITTSIRYSSHKNRQEN